MITINRTQIVSEVSLIAKDKKHDMISLVFKEGMKTFIVISLIFSYGFWGIFHSNTAFAQFTAKEKQEMIKNKRELIRMIRASRADNEKLAELKTRLIALDDALKNSKKSNELKEEKRKIKLSPIKISISSISVTNGVPLLENGKASYYAAKFDGRRTASGEIFSNEKLTAAHKTLPFGTKVKVVNIENGKSIEVIINDRGPHVEGRIIDLSTHAFSQIDALSKGIIEVLIEVVPEEF